MGSPHRIAARGAAVVFGFTLALSVNALPANADTARDGSCDSSEACFYPDLDNVGSVSDFLDPVGDYGKSQPSCYEFKGEGAGQGECLKNGAASVWNRSSMILRVHYNSDYAGAYQDFAPGEKGNLNETLTNDNASHSFVDVPASALPKLGRLAPDNFNNGPQAHTAGFRFDYHHGCSNNEVVHDDLLTNGPYEVTPWMSKNKITDYTNDLKGELLYRTGYSKWRVTTFCTNNTPTGAYGYYTTYTPVEYVYQTQFIQRYTNGGVAAIPFPKSDWMIGTEPPN